MSEWRQYKRKGLSELGPYILNEDLANISVSLEDGPTNDMSMIARNPKKSC